MQKIVNFLRGTVRLELTGAFPERFLNICAAENLPFWQVEQPDEHTLRITLAGQDRRRAIEAAKRSLCQVTELGREGFPAFCHLLCISSFSSSIRMNAVFKSFSILYVRSIT